jgi:hypothetical protein
LETRKQQSNAPGFMPVNSSNSVESVELEILQVGETLNEQLSGRLANHHAVFQVAYITVSMVYCECEYAWQAFYGISNLTVINTLINNNS